MDPLESARERLEAALSQLASQAMNLHGHLSDAGNIKDALQKNEKELYNLKSALERVEMENLRLHEQIAILTLEDRKNESEAAEIIRNQKEKLEQDHNLLLIEHARLEKEFTKLKISSKQQKETSELEAKFESVTKKARDTETNLLSELEALKKENDLLRQDKEAFRSKLDMTIKKVEALVGEEA